MIEVDDNAPRLLNALNRLVNTLEPATLGDPMCETVRATGPDRWEDEDYVYIEANLPVAS